MTLLMETCSVEEVKKTNVRQKSRWSICRNKENSARESFVNAKRTLTFPCGPKRKKCAVKEVERVSLVDVRVVGLVVLGPRRVIVSPVICATVEVTLDTRC